MSPDRLSGYLCPPCADAVTSEGSIGQSAMHRSLSAHLRSIGRDDDADRLRTHDDTRLVGWSVSGLPPSENRWQHLRLS
jgi:hypothetical protein